MASDTTMAMNRAHIVLPPDLLAEIDSVVGPGGRGDFIVEVARAELARRRLLTFLSDPSPIWLDGDHPELLNGADAWLRSLRSESDRPQPTKS